MPMDDCSVDRILISNLFNNMTLKIKETTPSKNRSYIPYNTGAVGVKQYNCRCGWGHIDQYLEKTCQWTDNLRAVAIALQVRPDASLREIKESKALVCWYDSDNKKSALVQAIQQLITDDYWVSKEWSSDVEAILSSPNCLSRFGSELYGKMLDSERFNRYAYKKQLRQLEDVL